MANNMKLQILLAAKDVTGKTFKGVIGKVKTLSASVFSLKNAFIGAAAAGGAGLFIKSSLDVADAIGKAADRIGISTDALQAYRHAAGLAGVDQSVLESGLEAFTKRIGEARQGTGAMLTYLKKYNEELLNNILNAESTSGALSVLFDEMSKMSSASDKAALSAAAFSRSAGVKMTNMVKGGMAGLKKSLGEAKKYGLVVSEETIRNAETANDKMSTVLEAVKSKFVEIGGSFAPAITKISEKFLQWIAKNRELIQKKIDDLQIGVVDSITGIAGALKLLRGGDLIPEFDGSNLETFSETASKAATVVLKLAQGFLKLKEVWGTVKEVFHSLKAWSNERFADVWGTAAKVIPGKENAKMFRGLQRAAGEVAVESRGAAVIAAEETASIRAQSAQIQTLIDGMTAGIELAHKKTAAAAAGSTEQIKKVVRTIEGKPVDVYINIKPAMKDLDRLEQRVKKMKLSLNMKITGEASSRKPLTEKINDILDLYKKFPEKMKMNIDMTSLSGAYQAIEAAQKNKGLGRHQIAMGQSSLDDLARQQRAHSGPWNYQTEQKIRFAASDRMSAGRQLIGEYDALIGGIQQLIASGYYGDGGSAGGQSGGGFGGGGARLNIGPINVSVSGTGGDRDLAITLADEMDHEIAQKIVHNRSEITAALGITNVSN